MPADEFDDRLARLRAMLSDLEAHRDQPNPSLTVAHLNNVKATVETINTLLRDDVEAIFTRPRNSQNAHSPLNQLGIYIRSWPATGPVRLTGLSKRIESAEGDLESLAIAIVEENDKLEAQIAQYDEQAQTLQNTFTTVLAEARHEHEQWLEARMVEIREDANRLHNKVADTEATIAEQTTRIDSVTITQQEAFANAQDERTKEWKAFLDVGQQTLEDHSAEMARYEAKSREVLAKVGVNATAGDYAKYAESQANVANRWRIGAVVALSIAAAFFLTASLLSFFNVGVNLEWWQILVQKIGAPAGVAAVGYMLFRESGQHRKEERAARQIQLTLTALEPFIANLPSNQQEQIRVETARKIFAQQETTASSRPSASSLAAFKSSEDENEKS